MKSNSFQLPCIKKIRIAQVLGTCEWTHGFVKFLPVNIPNMSKLWTKFGLQRRAEQNRPGQPCYKSSLEIEKAVIADVCVHRCACVRACSMGSYDPNPTQKFPPPVPHYNLHFRTQTCLPCKKAHERKRAQASIVPHGGRK